MSSKIAFLLPDMRGGGAERVALTLIDHFVARGFAIDLVLLNASGGLLCSVPQGVRVIDLKAARIRHALKGIADYLRTDAPIGLQVSMWPLTVIAILAKLLARSSTRIVVSDHVAYSSAYLSPRQLRALRWTTRLFYPRAAARIVVSNHAAEIVSKFSGIPRDQFSVVYNPVVAPDQIATTPEVDRIWGSSHPRILTVGSLVAVKRHELLIRAFREILETHPDASLTVLGEGELREELSSLAAKLGISDRVHMPGFRSNPWPFYASADLFVLSSDYEGYPLVLIEAMLAGLPVVSTDCPSGPREILERGKFGALVPVGDVAALADAMEQALATDRPHPDVRQRAAILSAGTCERYEQLLLGTAA